MQAYRMIDGVVCVRVSLDIWDWLLLDVIVVQLVQKCKPGCNRDEHQLIGRLMVESGNAQLSTKYAGLIESRN